MLVTFSITVVSTCPEELKGGKVYVSSLVPSSTGGKDMETEWGAAGHFAPTVKKQRTVNAWLSSLSPFHAVQGPSLKNDPTPT